MEQFGQGRTLIGQGTGNDGSTSMSFTANSTGGSYKHNHIYGIKVNEYYSVTSNLRVRKSDGSWQGGIRDGTGHAYFNNCSQAGNKELIYGDKLLWYPLPPCEFVITAEVFTPPQFLLGSLYIPQVPLV